MDIKQKTTFEVKVGERVHLFLCDSESTLGELFDVLSILRQYVVERIQQLENAETKKE
jgi:hypothetical protein